MGQEQRFDQREINPNRNAMRWQMGNLDQFLDSHPEIAEQLRKDPSLVNNKEFVGKHPALQTYLQQHPGVHEEFSENPDAFMRREQRFDRQEDGMDHDTTRGQLASADRFFDTHPEIAEQLRKDPSLVNNKEFVKNHPDLQTYLQQHPGVNQELSENPNAFMHQEQRFDRQEDGLDRDTTRGQLASADRFFDTHPEIAEQLRKDPSLVNNKEFVKNHPDLQTYLQQHPGVNQELSQNPNAFMHQEQRFDRQEDFGRNGASFGDDRDRREMASFGEFLGAHANIAAQISKDPSLLNNKEYMENHPELQEYLKAHPGMQEEVKENPQAFLQSAQQASKPAPKTSTLQKSPAKQQ
jgi:hypothetical protein